MQGIAEYPMISDEKLEEYLSIWDRLIENGQRKMLDITLQFDYKWDMWRGKYVLAYGEERRALNYVQAWRVKDWLESLPQGATI